VLAHACWIVADLPKNEVMAPFAIVETAQGRQLLHFEASTQAEAVMQGKAFLAHPPEGATRIAFVRDLIAREPGGSQDVLAVTGWERDGQEVTAMQRYRFDKKGTFHLEGPIEIVRDGVTLDPSIADPTIDLIRDGIADHPKAASLWSSWQNEKEGRP